MIKVKHTLNGLTPTEKLLVDRWFSGGSPTPPVEPYTLITPVDTDKFPLQLNNMKMFTLNGTEYWSMVSTGYYVSEFSRYFSGISRTGLHAFSEHWEFDAVTKGGGDLDDERWMFNGSSSVPINGNITFKNSYTAQGTATWKAYLSNTPEHILIPLNTTYADRSEWKPAKRNSDGVTGYWNGDAEFIAVCGGIAYFGENLVTQAIIDATYNNAWVSPSYYWTTASNSYSFSLPVVNGKYYRVEWDTTNSATVGTIFRYGFTDINEPKSDNVLSTPRARTTPQEAASVDLLASGDYLVVQVSGGTYPTNMTHLSIREMIGYNPSSDMLTALTGDNGGANSAQMLNTLTGGN